MSQSANQPPGNALVDEAQRQALARRGLLVVDREARQRFRRYRHEIELDELRSIGREALVRAIAHFDPSRGRFEAFARHRIRGAMADEARKRRRRRITKRPQVAAARAADRLARPLRTHGARAGQRHGGCLERRRGEPGKVVSGGDLAEVAMCHHPDPEAVALASSDAQRLRERVAALPRRQRVLIERHYFAGRTLVAVARELGISRHAVRRLHQRSLGTLARSLQRLSLLVPARRATKARRRGRLSATRAARCEAPSSPG